MSLAASTLYTSVQSAKTRDGRACHCPWIPVPSSCRTRQDARRATLCAPIGEPVCQQAASASPGPGGGVRVLVGNRKLMVEHGVTLPRDAVEYVRRQEGGGCTCMLVAGGERLARASQARGVGWGGGQTRSVDAC